MRSAPPPSAPRSPARLLLLAFLTGCISLLIALVASELVLRVAYRDGGTTTLGGPGGSPFTHTFIPGTMQRGPLASGPKAGGVQRLMILGDSITWGDGVTEWTDTYPVRLLTTLNANAPPQYDLAVHAYPGREIHNHVTELAATVDAVQPDIVVYQWFHNDVEIVKDRRPDPTRAWQEPPWHPWLRQHSYLYFVLDFALGRMVPGPGRDYLAYMEADYAAGTPGWRDFARAFHAFAAYATGHASRTILMLYPATPPAILADLRQRVAALAGGQVVRATPPEMHHPAGRLLPDGSAISARPGAPAGRLAYSPAIPLARGQYQASVALRLDAPATGAVALVRVTAGPGSRELAALEVTATEFGAVGAWTTVAVPFEVAEATAADVVIHVEHRFGAVFSAGTIELPVRYGIEVLDLAPWLDGRDTATSRFDAHPSAATHAVMADALARTIRRGPVEAAQR